MSCEYDEKYFKRHYSTDLYRRYLDVRNRFLWKRATAYVPAGRFLEVGFGDDNLVKFFRGDFEVYGVDISGFAVEEIVGRGYHPANFRICDVCRERIPFEGGFDLICAMNTIEHLEDYRAALRNISDALRDGGIFAAYLPIQSNFLSRLQYRFLYDAEEHVFRPSHDFLSGLLAGMGFSLCEECCATFIPLRVTSRAAISSFNLYLGIWRKEGPA